MPTEFFFEMTDNPEADIVRLIEIVRSLVNNPGAPFLSNKELNKYMTAFITILKMKKQAALEEFIKNGGAEQDFEFGQDDRFNEFKGLLQLYKDAKNAAKAQGMESQIPASQTTSINIYKNTDIGHIPNEFILTNNPDADIDQLLEIIRSLIRNPGPSFVSNKVLDYYKSAFISSLKKIEHAAHEEFVKNGGADQDFEFADDERFDEFVRLIKQYKTIREEAQGHAQAPKTQTAKLSISTTQQGELKKGLLTLFQELESKSQKDFVDLEVFMKEAKKAKLVDANINQNRFSEILERTKQFEHGLVWKQIKFRFNPRLDMHDFIYFGYSIDKAKNKSKSLFPSQMKKLKDLALPEIWDYENPKEGVALLENYFMNTLYRLRKEDKVVKKRSIADNSYYAAFNTGLVDKLYRPICCLLQESDKKKIKQPWTFKGFGVFGQDSVGVSLSNKIGTVPPAAKYFEGADVLFDDSKQIHPDYKHIIIENIDRIPENTVKGAMLISGISMPETTKKNDNEYKKKLGKTIENNSQVYNILKNRIDNAIELARKRASWNYKTAIPMYYPRNNEIGLFLPLCIQHDDVADLALVIQKGEQGDYIGKTIYLLQWAYDWCRLVCRPDSDWLSIDVIKKASSL